MPTFNVEKAKQSGYSSSEISDYLSKNPQYIPSQPSSGMAQFTRKASDVGRALSLRVVPDVLGSLYAGGQALKNKVTGQQTTGQQIGSNPFMSPEQMQQAVDKPITTGLKSPAGIASWTNVPGVSGALQALSQDRPTAASVGTSTALSLAIPPALSAGGKLAGKGFNLGKNGLVKMISEPVKETFTKWAEKLVKGRSVEFAVQKGIIPQQVEEMTPAFLEKTRDKVGLMLEDATGTLGNILQPLRVPAARVQGFLDEIAPSTSPDPKIVAFRNQAARMIDDAVGHTSVPGAGDVGLDTVNEIKKLAWKNYGREVFNQVGNKIRNFIAEEADKLDSTASPMIGSTNKEMHEHLIPIFHQLQKRLGAEHIPTIKELSPQSDFVKDLFKGGLMVGLANIIPGMRGVAPYLIASSVAKSASSNPQLAQKLISGLESIGPGVSSIVRNPIAEGVQKVAPRASQAILEANIFNSTGTK